MRAATTLSGTLLALFGLLLVVPSTNVHRFDGVPLSRLTELLGLVILVPFLAGAPLRRLHGIRLRRLPAPARIALAALAAGALAVKLVLLVAGPHTGFVACYRSPVAPPPAGACERSYQNPAARFGATRLDRRLDFTPERWDLSFINSLRFNFYPWVKGNVRHDRLPLAVAWTGALEAGRGGTAEIHYTGEAVVRVGTMEPVRLPARYDALGIVAVPVPAGRHVVSVEYRFDDRSRVGDGRSYGPWATFRLLRDGVPVEPAAPPLPWRAAGAAVDGVVVLLAAVLATTLARALTPDGWLLAAVAVAAPAGYLADRWLPPAVPRGLWLIPTLAIPLGALLARARARRLLTAYVAIMMGVSVLALERFGRFDIVGYRFPGDDWLTYESLARSILETWSPRGAEDVFYYQPLFRYLRFGEHLLLGDGDPFILIAALASLLWGIFWLVAAARGPARTIGARAIGLALCALALLLWACSPTVVDLVQTGVSEYPTWILLPFAVRLLFVSRSTGAWLWGALLLGAGLLTRTNHLPAVAGLLALFLWRAGRLRPRAALTAALLFGAVALLPALHNYHYGGRLVPFTTSANIPQNLVLAPSRLLDLGHDLDARTRLWSQTKLMLYVTHVPDRVLEAATRALQALWVASLVAVAWSRRGGPVGGMLLAVPLLYLVPHVFYQTYHRYPRHFLAGYLAMGAVALLVWGQTCRRSSVQSPHDSDHRDAGTVRQGHDVRRVREVHRVAGEPAP